MYFIMYLAYLAMLTLYNQTAGKISKELAGSPSVATYVILYSHSI